MKVASSFYTIPCKVCGVETIKRINSENQVCEACNRFYRRYKTTTNGKQTNLLCKTGLNSCLNGPMVTPEVSRKGLIWRNLCAACRFEKCKAVVGLGSSSPSPRRPPLLLTQRSADYSTINSNSSTTGFNCCLSSLSNEDIQSNNDDSQCSSSQIQRQSISEQLIKLLQVYQKRQQQIQTELSDVLDQFQKTMTS